MQNTSPRIDPEATTGSEGDTSVASAIERISTAASPAQATRMGADVGHWADVLWKRTRGPMLATVVVVAAHLLGAAHFATPDLVPLYLVVVVAIAAMDGSGAAMVSGLIIVVYLLFADSDPGHLLSYSRDHLLRLGIFVGSMLAIAVLAGAQSRRSATLRRELLANQERLAEAVKAKSEFMNAAAHQLRTPLTVIAGYVSMLQDETFGRLPERFRDPVHAMQRKAREVGALIDEMLLAARIQRGTAPTALMPVDLREAVRKAVERAEPRVTLEQATLSYELPSALVAVDVDPDHVAHILDNLISNALTYSDRRPWVKVTVTSGSDARVMVKDRGWGVPDAMRLKIFDGFVHYADLDHRPRNGRGLGLAVSRELAERYGGSLDLVQSDPGKGSLFVLRLPQVS